MVEYKKGEIVQLKSGGPAMTMMSQRQGYSEIRCVWFDKDDVLRSDEFEPESLRQCQLMLVTDGPTCRLVALAVNDDV